MKLLYPPTQVRPHRSAHTGPPTQVRIQEPCPGHVPAIIGTDG